MALLFTHSPIGPGSWNCLVSYLNRYTFVPLKQDISVQQVTHKNPVPIANKSSLQLVNSV